MFIQKEVADMSTPISVPLAQRSPAGLDNFASNHFTSPFCIPFYIAHRCTLLQFESEIHESLLFKFFHLVKCSTGHHLRCELNFLNDKKLPRYICYYVSFLLH